MSKAAIGARVMFCGHAGYFLADIYRIGNVNVIRGVTKIKPEGLYRNQEIGPPTHHVSDFPSLGFWRPDIGVLVVPAKQCRELKGKKP